MIPGRSKSNFTVETRQSLQGPASTIKESKDDLFPDLDVRMRTAKGQPNLSVDATDVRMSTLAPTVKAQPVFKPWERVALDNNEVRRKATVAQLCTLFQSTVSCSYLIVFRFLGLLFCKSQISRKSQRKETNICRGHW
jgi:hypothetical protein